MNIKSRANFLTPILNKQLILKGISRIYHVVFQMEQCSEDIDTIEFFPFKTILHLCFLDSSVTANNGGRPG